MCVCVCEKGRSRDGLWGTVCVRERVKGQETCSGVITETKAAQPLQLCAEVLPRPATDSTTTVSLAPCHPPTPEACMQTTCGCC